MARSIRTILIMLLGPPVLLLVAAQVGLLRSGADGLALALLVIAWGTGMLALITSGWADRVKIGAGVAYSAAAIPILPFVTLLAVCTTGDCI